VTLAFARVEKASDGSRRALLVLHAALLAACLGLGAGFGPFADADRPMAVLVGMLAVAAMATQNALVKLALKHAPSTAVMSTNITQLTSDLATLARAGAIRTNLPAPTPGEHDLPLRHRVRGRLCGRGRP